MHTDLSRIRSYLFVPADRPERIAKAFAAGADAIVVDWEDAVAAADKAQARAYCADWLRHNPQPPVWLRINAAGSTEQAADLAALGQMPPLAGLLLPKTEQPEHVSLLHRQSGLPVIALLESARGILNLPQIAAAEGLAALSFGCLDLAASLGLAYGSAAAEDWFDRLRGDLLLHSAANGLPPPVDTVYPDFRDSEGLQRRISRSRDLGFGSMLCIHPAQIATVHTALAATAEQLDFARRVLAAHRQTGAAAFQLDGQMVDMPVILRAQTLLQRHGVPES